MSGMSSGSRGFRMPMWTTAVVVVGPWGDRIRTRIGGVDLALEINLTSGAG